MSIITAAKASFLVSQVENANQELEESLRLILNSCAVPSNREFYLSLDLLKKCKITHVARELEKFPMMVCEIKELLSRQKDWAYYNAYQNNLVQESLDFIFHNISTQIQPGNIYPTFSDYKAEPVLYPAKVYRMISLHIEILINLSSADENILIEISTYNILPRLLFLTEKIPIYLQDNSYKQVTIPLRDNAIKLSNLYLKNVQLADKVCKNGEIFRWILRITKNTIANSKEVLLAELVCLLSYSSSFVPELDYEWIIRDWIYGNISMILRPETRSDD